MDAERIKFERTGGFASIRLAADIELRDLPEDQASALRGLLTDLNFAKLSEKLMGKQPIPDGFTYVITAEGKGRSHTVTADDSSTDEKFGELLQLLTSIARSKVRGAK